MKSRRQRTEDRRQRTEDRRQRTDEKHQCHTRTSLSNHVVVAASSTVVADGHLSRSRVIPACSSVFCLLSSVFRSHWRRQNRYLTLLLWPLEGLFCFVAALRRYAYSYGLLPVRRLPVSLCVVGNIHIGGMGKTPLTIFLLSALQSQGLKVGVISRGYGAQVRQPRLVTPSSCAYEVGDEPLLLARTGAPVVVGVDRVAAAEFLLRHYSDLDLVLSDDGLQHYRLARDLEIVVLDGQYAALNQHLLPNGPLREPFSRLKTVDALVINGGDCPPSLPLSCALPRFSMRLVPGAFYSLAKPLEQRCAADFAAEKVAAVTGIGQPERFFSLLIQLGLSLQQQLIFPDHHPFTLADLPKDVTAIIVTAKDAVKMAAFKHAKLWVLPVKAELEPDLATWIVARIKGQHGC